jgi:hypothetical protein
MESPSGGASCSSSSDSRIRMTEIGVKVTRLTSRATRPARTSVERSRLLEVDRLRLRAEAGTYIRHVLIDATICKPDAGISGVMECDEVHPIQPGRNTGIGGITIARRSHLPGGIAVALPDRLQNRDNVRIRQ